MSKIILGANLQPEKDLVLLINVDWEHMIRPIGMYVFIVSYLLLVSTVKSFLSQYSSL